MPKWAWQNVAKRRPSGSGTVSRARAQWYRETGAERGVEKAAAAAVAAALSIGCATS